PVAGHPHAHIMIWDRTDSPAFKRVVPQRRAGAGHIPAPRLKALRGAFTREMNPEEHDELMARISHMPHLLSFASMCLAEDLTLHKQILGAGFRDFTRIAASDHHMWKDILLDNREHLLGLIDRYTEELTRLRSLMELGSETALADVLARYAQIRRTLQ
ncbi:MAG: prephenate dehydrogenase dimerization domain-containing protein, partial [Desulfomonilia bacterium]|nr:prephenate dehydrogenase dimerization domain-containing protein [Desulfomonilia bacterium]